MLILVVTIPPLITVGICIISSSQAKRKKPKIKQQNKKTKLNKDWCELEETRKVLIRKFWEEETKKILKANPKEMFSCSKIFEIVSVENGISDLSKFYFLDIGIKLPSEEGFKHGDMWKKGKNETGKERAFCFIPPR